jgi:hypothetical protein
VTLTNASIFVAGLGGFIALSLAMPRHSRHVFQRMQPASWRRMYTLAGWIFLAVALALAVVRWSVGISIVTWLGWLTIAGVVLVFCLPYWPLRPDAEIKTRPDKKRPDGTAVPAGHTGAPQFRLPAKGLAAAAVALPLCVFTWQVLTSPHKPLLREDAVRGQIGPWAFSLAEYDRKAPELVAFDVPLKTFVIRFCEGCDRDIRMAYLKVRKPHSLRAAGNAFEGRGPEKTVVIPLPRAAALSDGIWLTVEANNGEVHQQEFEIKRLSPASAEFIRERL